MARKKKKRQDSIPLRVADVTQRNNTPLLTTRAPSSAAAPAGGAVAAAAAAAVAAAARVAHQLGRRHGGVCRRRGRRRRARRRRRPRRRAVAVADAVGHAVVAALQGRERSSHQTRNETLPRGTGSGAGKGQTSEGKGGAGGSAINGPLMRPLLWRRRDSSETGEREERRERDTAACLTRFSRDDSLADVSRAFLTDSALSSASPRLCRAPRSFSRHRSMRGGGGGGGGDASGGGGGCGGSTGGTRRRPRRPGAPSSAPTR